MDKIIGFFLVGKSKLFLGVKTWLFILPIVFISFRVEELFFSVPKELMFSDFYTSWQYATSLSLTFMLAYVVEQFLLPAIAIHYIGNFKTDNYIEKSKRVENRLVKLYNQNPYDKANKMELMAEISFYPTTMILYLIWINDVVAFAFIPIVFLLAIYIYRLCNTYLMIFESNRFSSPED